LPIESTGDNTGVTAIDLVFKALADPTRRKLVDRLHAASGQTLSALCQHLDMTRQAVTQHLALLEAANLISVQRQGREKLHYINPVPIHDIYHRWIRKFEQPRLEALHALKTTLEGSPHDQEHHHEQERPADQGRNHQQRAVRVRHLHRDHG
jgi:DNA-binding transcriptional ArsR family regulator